jgi:hypothetical protein
MVGANADGAAGNLDDAGGPTVFQPPIIPMGIHLRQCHLRLLTRAYWQ